MRERILDSFPRPPSPSPTRDRDDANESSKAIRRSGQSPFQIDAVSCGIDDRRAFREQSVDGIRREITYSAPYEVDRPKRDGFSVEGRREHSHLHRNAFSGVDYPNRSDSPEIVQRRCGASMRYSEDPYTEQFQSPMKHLSDEPYEPSRFIPLHDYNYKYSPSHGKNDKTDRLESFFRDCIDSSRHRSKPFPESEVVQTEAITVATKGESSPLSQIGSSGVDFQDESSKCCIRANDLDRVNDARPSYSGNHCASQVLQRVDHVGRNSPRDQQGECMRGLSYGDRGSPSVSRCGKEVVDESLKICRIGSDIEAKETFPCVGNMARETGLLMQAARGSLSKSYVLGSDIVDVNAAGTHLEFSTKEKTTDQGYFVKERYSFVALGSSVVNEQDDKAHHQTNFHYRKRDAVYLDQKCQLLENDGVDSGMYLDSNGPVVVSNRYDKAPQSKRLCLKKEREAYLDNERKAVYSDDKRRELGNEYCFGNDRMHSDLHEAGIVVDRDDKAPQSKMICLNKEREACMESEKKAVYSDDKRRNEYRFGNDDKIHSDFHEADIVVDRDDKAPHNITVCLNKGREEAYLDNERKAVYLADERRELRNEYHFGHDSRMHSDVHERDIVVDRDGKVVKHGQVCINKREAAYMDNERRDVYVHYRSQQLKKDYDSGPDARIYPDVRRLDIVVDHEDARDLSYRGVSLNDRKEPYLQCESQQRLKDHETAPYGMMHSDVNKSDFLVNREEARALEHRGVYYDDGKESYSDNERRDGYMRYPNQQRKKDYDYGIDDRVYHDVNSSDIIVDHGDARALERRGVSYNDEKEAYLDNERRDGYLRYKNHKLKEDYEFGIDDRMYHDSNRSQIVVDQRVDRGLELRELSFNDGNGAYLDNGKRDAYPRYKTQQVKKDYDSGIDARMCHDVNRSEIVVDRELARASERRGVSLYDDGREAYLHHESQKLQNEHEIDSHRMMHPNVSISSARKQDEEARRYRRCRFDDRKQMSLDDECLQLRNGGHVKAHANMRYPDGRQEVVYHSNDEILLTRDGNGLRPGVVIHEKMADDYNYRNVKQLGMSDEKPYSGRFRDREVAYDYRDKLGNYAVEGGTSRERFRYLGDERNSGNDDHTSAPRPRISAKERLGGRVEESRVPVKYRLLHPVKNPKVKGKSHHNRWRKQP